VRLSLGARMQKSRSTSAYRLLCDLLIKARKRAGLTQAELALRLKRPQSFVAKYENGERRLDVIELVIIAKAIGTDPGRMLRTVARALQGE
jgi:transcriptional regulator with XRE-family HTH domain